MHVSFFFSMQFDAIWGKILENLYAHGKNHQFDFNQDVFDKIVYFIKKYLKISNEGIH